MRGEPMVVDLYAEDARLVEEGATICLEVVAKSFTGKRYVVHIAAPQLIAKMAALANEAIRKMVVQELEGDKA